MGMYTQSAIVTMPTKHTDIGSLSPNEVDELTLDVWDEMDYKEQCLFHRLYPQAYDRIMELQRKREVAQMGRTTYADIVGDTTTQNSNTANMSVEDYERLVDEVIARHMKH